MALGNTTCNAVCDMNHAISQKPIGLSVCYLKSNRPTVCKPKVDIFARS